MGERESGLQKKNFNATQAGQDGLDVIERESRANSTDSMNAALVLGGMVARLVSAGAVIVVYLPNDSKILLTLPGMEGKSLDNLLAWQGRQSSADPQ